MNKIAIITADDSKAWAKFLSSEIQDLAQVDPYNVDALGTNSLGTLNPDLVCIILSPVMLEQKKKFIQRSTHHLVNPIIILCGVQRQEMEKTPYCDNGRKCQVLTVTSDDTSTAEFKKLIHNRLLEWNNDHLTIIPDTLIEKTNKSCVLMFPKPFLGEVGVLIEGFDNRLIATKKDTKTYVFDVPDLPEGKYKLLVLGSNKIIPVHLSLTIISTRPKECECQYIRKILDSNDFHPLDDLLVSYMENDYSNRQFYQHMSNPNPELPEFPTVLHFASAHGMPNVLKHLLKTPFAKEGLKIKNDKDMNCVDIANNNRHIELSSYLQRFIRNNESPYLDMSQNPTYTQMGRN